MKLDPDLEPEKKVVPWGFGWCIVMQMNLPNKNIGSISGCLSRGGLCTGKTGLIQSRGLPGDLAMTKPPYCYSN